MYPVPRLYHPLHIVCGKICQPARLDSPDSSIRLTGVLVLPPIKTRRVHVRGYSPRVESPGSARLAPGEELRHGSSKKPGSVGSTNPNIPTPTGNNQMNQNRNHAHPKISQALTITTKYIGDYPTAPPALLSNPYPSNPPTIPVSSSYIRSVSLSYTAYMSCPCCPTKNACPTPLLLPRIGSIPQDKATEEGSNRYMS